MDWGIAVRRLADAQRRRPAFQPSLDKLPEWAGTTAPSAEDQALASGGYGDIDGALNRLPADLLAVARATVVDGLTSREAARLLGIPVARSKRG
jgi:RNA polymerase sigma-70 factor, ECF subfamily